MDEYKTKNKKKFLKILPYIPLIICAISFSISFWSFAITDALGYSEKIPSFFVDVSVCSGLVSLPFFLISTIIINAKNNQINNIYTYPNNENDIDNENDSDSDNDNDNDKIITKLSSIDSKKFIEIVGNRITVIDKDGKNTATIKSINQSINDKKTKDLLSKVYGTEINYTSYSYSEQKLIWRIFFIDFTNKYGDGKGTIYLKADYNPNNLISLSEIKYKYIMSEETNARFLKMNPNLAKTKSISSLSTKERIIAALCDESLWKQYKSKNEIYCKYVNYAIAGPSEEMYNDSKQISRRHTEDFDNEKDELKRTEKTVSYLLNNFDKINNFTPTYFCDKKYKSNAFWYLASSNNKNIVTVRYFFENEKGGISNSSDINERFRYLSIGFNTCWNK